MDEIISSIDFNSIISTIITAFIIPVLIICSKKLVSFIKAKEDEVTSNIDNESISLAFNTLFDFVETAVVSTNQTIVDSLKNMDKFDKQSQIEAFNTTKNTILNSLSEQTINLIKSYVGDFDSYLDSLIQSSVNKHKSDRFNNINSNILISEIEETENIM